MRSSTTHKNCIFAACILICVPFSLKHMSQLELSLFFTVSISIYCIFCCFYIFYSLNFFVLYYILVKIDYTINYWLLFKHIICDNPKINKLYLFSSTIIRLHIIVHLETWNNVRGVLYCIRKIWINTLYCLKHFLTC